MNDKISRAINAAKNLGVSMTYARGGTPKDPQQDMHAMARMLEDVRGTNLGRQVGMYQNQPAGQSLQSLYGDLMGLAREGSPGRRWYEKSSRRILDYFHGDKNEADKFAQLIAIYSPQTTVPVNTGNAIKAYNRARAGEKLWDGDIIDRDKTFSTIKEAADYARGLGGENAGITRVPLDDSGKRFLIARHRPGSYENIATADRDLKAHLLMNEGVPFEGRKTNNFWNNLMVHIDPRRLQGSTQDLWMAHAFGFPDTAVGSGQKYTFMENLTQKLAQELGWRPHQVQAAIWTAIKTRMESTADDAKRAAVERGIAKMVPGKGNATKFEVTPGREDDFAELHREMALGKKVSRKQITESARDFSDFLDQNLGYVSWESAPSKRLAHLQGIEDLAPEHKAEYHGMVSRALQDENGNDLLAKYLGMMSPGGSDANGYWEGKSNPQTHLMVGSTRIKAAGQRPDIDTSSKQLMEIYAAAKGLLHKQDGIGYHRPFYNPQVTKANGIEFKFDQDLTPDHIVRLGKHIDTLSGGNAALIPINNRTLRMLNFGYPGTEKSQKPFHEAMQSAVGSAIPDTHSATAKLFASDGDLIGNDWNRSRNGEDYIRKLSEAGRSDVLEYVSTVLAPRLEEVDRAFAQKHGLQIDPQVEKAVSAAHQHPLAAPPAKTPAPGSAPALTPGATQTTMPPTSPPFRRGGSVRMRNGSAAVQNAVSLARQLKRGRP